MRQVNASYASTTCSLLRRLFHTALTPCATDSRCYSCGNQHEPCILVHYYTITPVRRTIMTIAKQHHSFDEITVKWDKLICVSLFFPLSLSATVWRLFMFSLLCTNLSVMQLDSLLRTVHYCGGGRKQAHPMNFFISLETKFLSSSHKLWKLYVFLRTRLSICLSVCGSHVICTSSQCAIGALGSRL